MKSGHMFSVVIVIPIICFIIDTVLLEEAIRLKSDLGTKVTM